MIDDLLLNSNARISAISWENQYSQPAQELFTFEALLMHELITICHPATEKVDVIETIHRLRETFKKATKTPDNG